MFPSFLGDRNMASSAKINQDLSIDLTFLRADDLKDEKNFGPPLPLPGCHRCGTVCVVGALQPQPQVPPREGCGLLGRSPPKVWPCWGWG